MDFKQELPQPLCKGSGWMEEGKGQPCEKKREFGDSYIV